LAAVSAQAIFSAAFAPQWKALDCVEDQGVSMRVSVSLLALCLLAACATGKASDAALQDAASLMVSIGQHGQGADIGELEAQIDAQVAAASEDPYLLKLAAESRLALADYAQDRAERVRLRQTALAELEKALTLSKPTDPARMVMLNGQEMAVDFVDLAAMRDQVAMQVQTDR
jgi:hypothetical protein